MIHLGPRLSRANGLEVATNDKYYHEQQRKSKKRIKERNHCALMR